MPEKWHAEIYCRQSRKPEHRGNLIFFWATSLPTYLPIVYLPNFYRLISTDQLWTALDLVDLHPHLSLASVTRGNTWIFLISSRCGISGDQRRVMFFLFVVNPTRFLRSCSAWTNAFGKQAIVMWCFLACVWNWQTSFDVTRQRSLALLCWFLSSFTPSADNGPNVFNGTVSRLFAPDGVHLGSSLFVQSPARSNLRNQHAVRRQRICPWSYID